MSRISIALRFSRTVFASCAALSSFRIAFSTEDALVFLLADARLASTTAAPVLHPSQMRLRGMSMIITRPYLMFLGDVPDELAAKTAHGIVDWRRDWCLGQLRLPGCRADLGLADARGEPSIEGAQRRLRATDGHRSQPQQPRRLGCRIAVFGSKGPCPPRSCWPAPGIARK